MSTKMLIDASHLEETRVAIVNHANRLEEFDFESATKQTIKGNIYLAKIMRVEPSLQAAFVDYGGNRHGFLAFSEIHPDYFRIPVSDREVLEAKLKDVTNEDDIAPEDAEADTLEEDNATIVSNDGSESYEYEMDVSTIAGESIDPMDETGEDAKAKRPPLHKLYKIQEVIHKNQILLIQVVKEERGQKGAALTTYLSLAGRYCVLMPNSPQAGGISRKISNPKDRQRLRETLISLEISPEMGLIIRTAGRERTRAEIRRDTDYLNRLWHDIRDETLQSIAPALIYQEDSIIKRAIRDQYSKDIDEILVEGEEGYKSAKNFIKKLMPSHAKRVRQYKDEKIPLFIKYKAEHQIEAMHESTVMLPSGGSIVIHPTEALVSIDINSGRSTRERHIEETAFNTNLEAATEIARQVRLRDLAGLIVIDFIDMDDRKYIAQVERKVREAFKNDRARVQMGKISPFGLLELSRQRLRPSILETSSAPCQHCHATGYIRSTESMALQVLRALEEEGIAQRSKVIKTVVPTAVAFYILNEKRVHLASIETRHEIQVLVVGDPALIPPEFRLIQIERLHQGGAESVSPHEERRSQKPDEAQERRHMSPSSARRSHDRQPNANRQKSQDENQQRHPRKSHQRAPGSGTGQPHPHNPAREQTGQQGKQQPIQDQQVTAVQESQVKPSQEAQGEKKSRRRNRGNRNRRQTQRRSEEGGVVALTQETLPIPTSALENKGTEGNTPPEVKQGTRGKPGTPGRERLDKHPERQKERHPTEEKPAAPKTAVIPLKPATPKTDLPAAGEKDKASPKPVTEGTAPESEKKKPSRQRKNWLKRLLE